MILDLGGKPCNGKVASGGDECKRVENKEEETQLTITKNQKKTIILDLHDGETKGRTY